MPRLIVCDLDGTLSDCRHREHLVPDWEAFHEHIAKDPAHWHVLSLLQDLRGVKGTGLMFLTGRPAQYRTVTTTWLAEVARLHEYDDYLELLMRKREDFRSDVIFKLEYLAESLREGTAGGFMREWGLDPQDPQDVADTVLILEDRERVVAAFRDAGYVCWQTAEGAF